MRRLAAAGKNRRAIRRDKFVLGLALVLTVPVLFGATQGGLLGATWLPIKLVVVPFLIFVQIIGWTAYVHHVSPDIRWRSRREWSQFAGQMESTTILRMPRLINRLWFHNIFVHIPHHVDARIPFHQLPQAAAAIASEYPDTVKVERFSIIDYARATRSSKLHDFGAGCWLPYSAAAARHSLHNDRAKPLSTDRTSSGSRVATGANSSTAGRPIASSNPTRRAGS